MKDSGSIYYQDEYLQIYMSNWTVVDGKTDVTTTTMQPYLYGQRDRGFIKDNILYKYGLITTIRQIIVDVSGGYVIESEGSSQREDYIQLNFPCGSRPVDTFKYHYDNALGDEEQIKITIGPHWTDHEDSSTIWPFLESDGEPVDITETDATTYLNWINIWG